ncbi:MAG: molybdopterin-dependent oxidoreductase, partial [Sphaerochaetaceae bacterium]|nr:molybdopterin-dependent oxidoreductase [Sphaerochaetaceae bacterium]
MFTVNINNTDYTSEKDMKLLPFLRDVLHFTGTKDGCSEGACGACTVIIDGKTSRACVPTLSKLQGKKIVTIEGLSEREADVYSYCFAQAGAVQCGFCIPGMIMSAKALLDVNNAPTREDVKKAIRGNICRCTGYIKIEDAILMAAEYFREDKKVDWDSEEGKIGQRMRRLDAVEKALGKGVYTDDIAIDGMVYGKCIRSKYPRARIVKIDKSRAEADERCVKVITAEDVPLNEHGHLIKDWPVFIQEGKITHYIGDAICMVVSEDQNALEELCNLVEIEYEELPGVFSAKESLEKRGVVNVHHDRDNIMYNLTLERGDVDKAIKESDYTVTYDFSTPHTEHAFMETECAVGCYDESTKGVLVYTSSQSIFDEQREISHLLRLDINQVRCKSMLVGGGFGGKEDMSVQHHAALAAYLLKRPVKVKLSRQESLNVHPKRHPMDMHVVIGCDKNGIIKGSTIDIISDTGAYASLGGPVLQRACTHAAGPYNYQNIRITGKALYTN